MAGHRWSNVEYMYKIYILQSLKDNKFYIGQTSNLEERLKYHDRGHVPSTRSRRPLKVVFTEDFENRIDAIKRERYLKKLKGGNEFKRIVGLI